jgi:hypothetical protein
MSKHSGLNSLAIKFGTALVISLGLAAQAQPDPNWLGHDRLRPPPTAVDPGVPSTQDKVGKAPSDAVVLFDGSDLSKWVSMDGSPTQWIGKDGYMECVSGSGYIRTLQNFGDCQLHVEWAAPVPAQGEGQGRGNSGVFFGLDRYEIQVLDSYQSRTYSDGSASSVYGQYPPLVNASRPPGQWQTYDILWTGPRFEASGKLLSAARLTVFHNGVLVQQNVELTGPTGWLGRAPYQAHPEKLPLAFQDHGNPVRFRNVWVRELGPSGKREFTFGNAVLDRCVGTYEVNPDLKVEVKREGSQLQVSFAGSRFDMFAETETKFFAKTTDVQCEFVAGADGKVEKAVLSVGEGGMIAKKAK